MISGHSQSVPKRPVGPCCSFEPMGTTTVLERVRRASISGQVDRCSNMPVFSVGASLARDLFRYRRVQGAVIVTEGEGARPPPQPRIPCARLRCPHSGPTKTMGVEV